MVSHDKYTIPILLSTYIAIYVIKRIQPSWVSFLDFQILSVSDLMRFALLSNVNSNEINKIYMFIGD